MVVMSTKTNSGCLALVSLGPGAFQHMTIAAQAALQSADIVIGYQVYIDLVRPLLSSEQKIIVSPIGRELERAEQAIELSARGAYVALISSGDIGIYAMASPVFELLEQQQGKGEIPEVEVFPGVSAVQAAAARLGAPLGHDFCTISLSDLLTPWANIERRLQAAAWGDFVIGFYNPRSQKRDWQLQRAIDILLAYRPAGTPVAIARNVTRPDEQVKLTTLAELDPTQVDMFTLILVGNSQSFMTGQRMVTPRGYAGDKQGSGGAGEQGCKGAGGQGCVTSFTGAEEQGGKGAEVRQSGLTPAPPHPRSPAPPLPRSPAPLPNHDVYPITLTSMGGVQAVVVGGGPVGERKTRGLLMAGVKVRLISPEATKQLRVWADTDLIEWQRRPYQSGDLAGAQLVFAATNRRAINAQVAEEAGQLAQLCNVADKPVEGNFHVPAVHRRPELVVAVSTSGQNPGRARRVRDEIAAWLNQSTGAKNPKSKT
jgi:cobalt-precorrin 5A hydrolase/precorrin-3B C17-methyltransferase